MDKDEAIELFNKELKRAINPRGKTRKGHAAPHITIDAREDRDGITAMLLRGMGYTTERRRLALGDYAWDSALGRVLVERKTPRDAEDFRRLQSQVERLRAGYDAGDIFPILLFDHADAAGRKWGDEDLDNVKLSIQGRIRVAHCQQGALAYRLDSLYRYTNKRRHRLLDQLGRAH